MNYQIDLIICFCEQDDDVILVAFAKGPAFYNLKTRKMSERLWEFELDLATVPNDGRCDRYGQFVFGGRLDFTFAKTIFEGLYNYYMIYNYYKGINLSSN